MSTALTGPAQDLGKNMLSGVQAAFERVNRNGGIHEQRLRLIALDDGYEPVRTAPNMNQLIDQDHVLAVIGNVGTPTAITAVPISNQKKTLLYAAYTGAGVLRKDPPDRYVINYRASYAEEIAAMINALIDTLGYKIDEIAFFTQRDGYGDAGFDGGINALKRHGLQDETEITHVRYERNTVAVENAVADILVTDKLPRAIIMVGAYAPCAKFIKLAKENGLKALYLNVSFVGSNPLAQQLKEIGEKEVIVTQVVPHYESDLDIAQEYRKDLAILNSKEQPSFGGLEGYIAARILALALDEINGEITRENIIDALLSLGKFNIGMDEDLLLNIENRQASHIIWPTILKDGQFIPFMWEELKGSN
ncbi:MAG: ABC transporter substrate-binding protein [Candidatus Omnitrophica bacterium]|nr:ABC transporter substrate-binding protein [Candidatus Omnitrophota bacterium]